MAIHRVLLVSEDYLPDHKTFGYTFELCQSMEAHLRVLQLISPSNFTEFFKFLQQKAGRIRHQISTSFMASAFAEINELESAGQIMDDLYAPQDPLIMAGMPVEVGWHFTLKNRNVPQKVADFVDSHRDVVLAVYDALTLKRRAPKPLPISTGGLPQKLKRMLPVPLVIFEG